MEHRVKNLEDKVDGLGNEVSTLTGQVNEHIAQVAIDKVEDRRDHAARHKDLMDVVTENATQLRVIAEIEDDRFKRGQVTGDFPAGPMPMNGRARIACYSAGGFGAVWIIVEVVKAIRSLQ